MSLTVACVPGVVITGPARSGTSMVAGLFAAHGVYFGKTWVGTRYNLRGFFEHKCIPKDTATAGEGWPQTFWQQLGNDGWDGKRPWGIKHVATRWRFFRKLDPTVVVLTTRPDADVLASLRRTGWRLDPKKALGTYHRCILRIREEAACPIVTVSSPALIRGEYDAILPAFDLLGVSFSPEIAAAWIEPALWNQGDRP